MVSDSGKNFSKEKGEILEWSNSNARQRTIRVIWTTKRNLKQFQPESSSYSNMGNRDKDKKQHSDAEATGEGLPRKSVMSTRSAGTSAIKGLLP